MPKTHNGKEVCSNAPTSVDECLGSEDYVLLMGLANLRELKAPSKY